MAKLKEEIYELTRRLITITTGLQVEDENFHLCMQFASSNFRYHRFLDIDSHRVNRQLEGLCTKLSVHSLEDRAKTLRRLVRQFLDGPLAENMDLSNTDTHYAMLFLVLTLAQCPTNAVYEVIEPQVPKAQMESFDWTSHLLDGEDLFFGYHSDTSFEEEELLDNSTGEESQETKERNLTSKSKSLVSMSTNNWISQNIDIHVGRDNSFAMSAYRNDIEDILGGKIIAQYWKDDVQSEVRGQHAASNLMQNWMSYQLASGETFSAYGQHMITEYELIREILWMMSGVEKLYAFKLTDSGYHLNDHVCLSHLTVPSLESCLSHLTLRADRLHTMKKFISNVITCSFSVQKTTAARVPLTYQAFAYSLSRILQDFHVHLSTIEKKLAQQDGSEQTTISSLVDKLASWLSIVDVLWEVYTNGECSVFKIPPSSRSTNSARTTCLLSALYSAVVTHDHMGEYSSQMMLILLRLLFETSRPYLDIIGQWIMGGHLTDPSKEFILQRNKSVQSLNETYWEQAFTLNTSSCQETSDILLPQEEASDVSQSSSGMFTDCEEQNFQDVQEAAPKFLQPILREVILTGKSMELLQDLGRLPMVVKMYGEEALREKSLYELFVESLHKHLGTLPSSSRNPDSELSSTGHLYMDYIYLEKHVTGFEDNLLRVNFMTIFSTLFTEKQVLNESSDLSSLNLPKESCIGPVQLLYQQCLYPHIQQQYKYVCSSLLDILKEEYHLLERLQSMQHFYLMSAGDVMFDFYTQVFHKIRCQEQWRDMSSLTLALHDSLQTHYPLDISRLSVTVEALPKAREGSAVNATDCIQLHYNVGWPVDMVISSHCQNLYNQVFHFLLHIKRTKYGLDQLRFSDLNKALVLTGATHILVEGDDAKGEISRKERLHRMHLLRFRFAYFVNSLHNYIMTRILHSTGLEFATEIMQATDLEQVIEVHARYVRTIHERCLLHKKLTFLRDAVTKVLNLTLIFSARWDQGIDSISGQILHEMEVEFSRCIQFLASFLNNIIKRGSFPHVEPLAFALVTSLPTDY